MCWRHDRSGVAVPRGSRASGAPSAFDAAFPAPDGGHADHIHAGKRRLTLSAAKTVNATSGAVLNR